MISGTIAGISSFTVYPLGEITIPRTSYSYYYISYTPSSASGTMWIKSTSTATIVSYQLSSYSGMLNFGNSYTQYLSFESFTCSSIETNIPRFKTYGTFSECGTLQRANLYNCISLASGAFENCFSLSQISLPVCKYIGDSAFCRCSSLFQVNLPKCEYIGYNTFFNCLSLSQISLPVCSYLSSYAFFNCPKLSQVSLPMCEYIGEYAFYDCYKLSQVSLPMCEYIGNNAFGFCWSLSQVSLPMCSYIGSSAFYSCKSLSIITLGYSGVCSLYDSKVFSYTLITRSTGSIYVPSSLVSAYKSASVWRFYTRIIQSYPGL